MAYVRQNSSCAYSYLTQLSKSKKIEINGGIESRTRLFFRMSMIVLNVRARFMQPGDCVIIQVDQSSYPMRWREQGTVRHYKLCCLILSVTVVCRQSRIKGGYSPGASHERSPRSVIKSLSMASSK